MTRWNTEELITDFMVDGRNVYADFPGGDCDTSVIVIQPEGSEDFIFVSGFITGTDPISDWDEVDVEMVEVSDGMDSSGGLNSRDPNVIQAYADVRKILARKGFTVVDRMEDYI